MNHRRADGGIFGWKYRLNCEEGVWRWASPIHQKQHTPWELVHSGRTVCRGSGLITVELSRWVCRPARPSAARRPFAGSGRGSSSHYAQSKPGCELRKDLKVRLLFASFFSFFSLSDCCEYQLLGPWMYNSPLHPDTNQRRAKCVRRGWIKLQV